MKLTDKNRISVIENIHQKILKVYPFLTKTEKNSFERKSQIILDKFRQGKLETENTIKDLMSLFNGSGHADVREWHKPKIRSARKRLKPTFNIKDRILFLQIPSWSLLLGDISKKLIDICLKNINKYDGIIIDVSGNGGGSSKIAHDFAGIFFKKDIVFGKFFKKSEKGKIYFSTGKLGSNKKHYLGKPLIILISRKCFSSNELFLAPFKISRRAVLIGESTAGGSANPISEMVNISGKKFVVKIPTWRFFLKGKRRPIEKTKIDPDIIYKGKDIEKFAKNYLIKMIKN